MLALQTLGQILGLLVVIGLIVWSIRNFTKHTFRACIYLFISFVLVVGLLNGLGGSMKKLFADSGDHRCASELYTPPVPSASPTPGQPIVRHPKRGDTAWLVVTHEAMVRFHLDPCMVIRIHAHWSPSSGSNGQWVMDNPIHPKRQPLCKVEHRNRPGDRPTYHESAAASCPGPDALPKDYWVKADMGKAYAKYPKWFRVDNDTPDCPRHYSRCFSLNDIATPVPTP
jgi:hypothetical protein